MGLRQMISAMNAKKIISSTIDIILILAVFTMTNSTAFSVTNQFPDLSHQYPYTIAIVVACLVALLFIQIHLLSITDIYIKYWKNQLSLLLFLAFCTCSLLWSVYGKASLYELSLMFFSTLIGVYLATRYKPETGFEVLRNFAIFSLLVSYLLLSVIPPLARLDNPQFLGAWRGIFWHRNHMGSLMAFFSSIFLLNAAITRNRVVHFIANIVLFILSAILIFGSRSATGILIFIFLNGLLLLLFILQKIRNRLNKKHYITLGIVGGLSALLILTNLGFIFSLLGRDTNLTGRIPLWADLVSRVWTEKPFLGYGFGALWNQESFRIMMQTRFGWPYQVYFSDNGYLDLLLNAGLIGLVLFFVFFISTGLRSINVFLKTTSLISLFPLLIFIYVLIANISYSFLLEVDQFVWMLLVISAILSMRLLGITKIPYNTAIKPQP